MAHGSFPRPGRRKPLLLLLLAALAAGCGSSARTAASTTRSVRGNGYAFAAPAGWHVVRSGRTVSASPGGVELVSVTVFPLARPYAPGLWAKVVPVLDGVAGQLAARLGGRISSRGTVVVAGRRAREYAIAFRRGGKDVVERTVFVLKGRREYQLLCRFEPGADAERACSAFVVSFRPA